MSYNYICTCTSSTTVLVLVLIPVPKAINCLAMAAEDRMNLCAAVLPALPMFSRAFPPLVPDAVRLLQRMYESCCAHSACVCTKLLSIRAPSPPSAAPFDAESGVLMDDVLPAADLPEYHSRTCFLPASNASSAARRCSGLFFDPNVFAFINCYFL